MTKDNNVNKNKRKKGKRQRKSDESVRGGKIFRDESTGNKMVNYLSFALSKGEGLGVIVN